MRSVTNSEMRAPGVRVAQMLIHLMFIGLSLLVIFPLLLTLVVSFSSEMSVLQNGYTFFPSEWSLAAYQYVLKDGSIFQAYLVTIFVTVVGTLLSVVVCCLCGYVISSPKAKYRNAIAMFLFIPTVFSAGVVPWYYLIKEVMNLANTIWVLILPNLVGTFNIFLIRNYYKSIPYSLVEAAEIDGAEHLTIFFRIIFPLGMPITATVSLFIALGYWNDFLLATWFIDSNHQNLYPLQYYLYQMTQRLITDSPSSGGGPVPTETVYVATMFLTMGPIVLVYPFVQRFFVKGITIGGVKG